MSIRGIWFPVPCWFIGSIMTCVALRDAPASHSKKAMIAFAVLVPLWLVVYIGTMIGIASTPSYYYYGFTPTVLGAKIWGGGIGYGVDGLGLSIASAVMLIMYDLFIVLFIVFADRTYRSMFGPVTSDLSDPIYLRGVNLGLCLASIFLFPWAPFALVGIPLVLHQLKKKRTQASGYGASLGVGIFAFVSLIGLILTLIIAGSISYGYTDYADQYYARPYYYDSMGNYIECPLVLKRAVLQTMTDATTTTIATVAATLSASSAISSVMSPIQASATTSQLVATVWWGDTTATLNTGDAFWTTADLARCATAMSDHPREYVSYYGSALNEAGGAIAVTVFCILYFVAIVAFTAVSDSMVLKLITPTAVASASPVGAQIVAPCVSCAAPLSFVRTGPTTQVQCYQCKSVCEFQVA